MVLHEHPEEFKGGTSLSKCYPESISRFSDDIDLMYVFKGCFFTAILNRLISFHSSSTKQYAQLNTRLARKCVTPDLLNHPIREDSPSGMSCVAIGQKTLRATKANFRNRQP
jgi:hypothetical protein